MRFGISGSRFRAFLSRINIRNLAHINKVRLAGVVLHNMLCQKSRHSYIPSDYLDQEDPITGHINPGQCRDSVPASGDVDVPLLPGWLGTRQAEIDRDALCEFLMDTELCLRKRIFWNSNMI